MVLSKKVPSEKVPSKKVPSKKAPSSRMVFGKREVSNNMMVKNTKKGSKQQYDGVEQENISNKILVLCCVRCFGFREWWELCAGGSLTRREEADVCALLKSKGGSAATATIGECQGL